MTDNGGSKGKFLDGPDGERTNKLTAAGDYFYVNQFYSVSPSGILPMKHIYAGETRVVTKTEPISQYPILTYYHPDHLGSTSYTSAPNQDLLQHERAFPFGERDFGDQEECDLGRPDNMRREWLFTGKELDWDTGLMYFGARKPVAREDDRCQSSLAQRAGQCIEVRTGPSAKTIASCGIGERSAKCRNLRWLWLHEARIVAPEPPSDVLERTLGDLLVLVTTRAHEPRNCAPLGGVR